MQSLFSEADAAKFADNPKQLRVYTSQLLGRNRDLVLHGGGNTSVKLTETDFFGNDVELLYVKGSGRDLATVDASGFSPVRMDVLRQLAELENVSDTDLVDQQRCAMVDSNAPNPSVESLLHAIIPHRYVDHTHADSIIAITNTENGQERIQEIFGERVLVVPYVMPGSKLARKIREMAASIKWDNFDGMVLMNHGLVTFHNEAQQSYETTIRLVTMAEKYLENKNANNFAMPTTHQEPDLVQLAQLRNEISNVRQQAVIAIWDNQPGAIGFTELENIDSVATRGPLTPDHSIYTKRIPLVWRGDISDAIKNYMQQYTAYFAANGSDGLQCLEPSPRWIVWPGQGLISIGPNFSQASVVADIAQHTVKVIQQAESLGGWRALPKKDIFDVEYWELEQAKLNNKTKALPLQGKIALVTGAASGIGLAAARQLHANGAAVLATDINPSITSKFEADDMLGAVCDVCDPAAIDATIKSCVAKFGGLDIVISNAGFFSQGSYIDQLNDDDWQRSLNLNLSQHKNLMQASHPFLKLGIDPTFIVIGSKNVAAPGPGASAYSVAKAGLNQLTRVAALEWGTDGIRVNIVHPDCVFDTELWAGGVLEQRAKKYEMSVDEYMTRNVLKKPVKSIEVANLIAILAGDTFAKTTGAQFPIDGGNDRVI